MSTVDCYDANALVHPGQAMYFTTRAAGRPGAVDFDYDCDGVERRRFMNATPATCRIRVDRICAGGAYWADETLPACGAPAELLSECLFDDEVGDCVRVTRSVAQSCR
jgi:hypothetical protein